MDAVTRLAAVGLVFHRAHLHSPVASAKSETVNQTLGEPIKRKLRQAETALGTHGRSRMANARMRPNRR
jgi:hypothetical protein